MRRIGVLTPLAADDPEHKARLAAFVEGLQQLGWEVGRNVEIETRAAQEIPTAPEEAQQNWSS